MKIRISEPQLMRDLMDALERGGCEPALLAADVCEVRHLEASDEREERVELSFFLRAWQVSHPQVSVAVVASMADHAA